MKTQHTSCLGGGEGAGGGWTRGEAGSQSVRGATVEESWEREEEDLTEEQKTRRKNRRKQEVKEKSEKRRSWMNQS